MAKIDFFLSFNSADRAIANAVYKTVSDAGFSCFYQHEDIPDGANFVQRMTSGLSEAATVIALFSPAYFQSRYALAELHALLEHHAVNRCGQHQRAAQFAWLNPGQRQALFAFAGLCRGLLRRRTGRLQA